MCKAKSQYPNKLLKDKIATPKIKYNDSLSEMSKQRV
jgi:hypothetical protein